MIRHVKQQLNDRIRATEIILEKLGACTDGAQETKIRLMERRDTFKEVLSYVKELEVASINAGRTKGPRKRVEILP